MEEKLRWYFIEFLSQLDIDDITDEDYQRACNQCYLDISVLDSDVITELWRNAEMCVAYP